MLRKGKVKENALKRSVIKELKNVSDDLIIGSSVGRDAAALACADSCISLSSDTVTYAGLYSGYYAILKAAGNIAVSSGEIKGFLISLLLPEGTTEEELKKIIRAAREATNIVGAPICGGHTEVTDKVNSVVACATGIGYYNKKPIKEKVKAGDDIVTVKAIGIEGTAIIANSKKDKLKEHLPLRFIEEACDFYRNVDITHEAQIAIDNDVLYMHDISQGGIFGALWELGEALNVGIEVNLKSIPLKQETVEICEVYGINPYELLSGGSLLMVTHNGEALVNAFEKENIRAVVIGKITDSNGKLILNDDEKRYLEMPQPDELLKII